MENALIIGFASMFAFVAVLVKIGILVYFFVLLHRMLRSVERIEQRCGSITEVLRVLPQTQAAPGSEEP